MSPSPPLRFLAIVLGGWAAARTGMLAPFWPSPPAGASAAEPRRVAGASPPRQPGPAPPPHGATPKEPPHLPSGPGARPRSRPITERLEARPTMPFFVRTTSGMEAPPAALAAMAVSPPSPLHAAPARPASARAAPRWSLSVWSFVRRGDSAPLAAGGLLGGSQAGARLAYRLNRDRE